VVEYFLDLYYDERKEEVIHLANAAHSELTINKFLDDENPATRAAIEEAKPKIYTFLKEYRRYTRIKQYGGTTDLVSAVITVLNHHLRGNQMGLDNLVLPKEPNSKIEFPVDWISKQGLENGITLITE
jgi:hypothetical protein